MAITKATFANFSEFLTWAETALVPTYYAAVDTVTESSTTLFTAYRDAEKTEPMFSWSSSGQLRVYKDATTNSLIQAATSGSSPTIALTCVNGVIITGGNKANVLISKTNNGATATVIAGNSTGNVGAYTSYYCATYGDDTHLTGVKSFSNANSNQTCLVPFCTYAAFEQVSYCPKAFYMVEGQYYTSGMGKFTTGNKMYITNGYWAILEE